jgi:predicted DNA-binding antitoxin AbrB/MazE fold protein
MNAVTVEAIYENGMVKPATPLPLKEHEKVRITIHAAPEKSDGGDPVAATYGIVKWNGDPEVARRIALDDEFGILEAP